MAANALEAALLNAAAQWIASKESSLIGDLAPFNSATANELATVAEKSLANTPIVGSILANAIKSDVPGFSAALAVGETEIANFLVNFCNSEAKKLAA